MANPAGQSSDFVALDIIPITPNDSVALTTPVRSIRAQVGGTLRIVTQTGDTRNTNIADNEILPVFVRQVMATGTTATGIEGLL